MNASKSLVASICERCGHVGKWVSPSYPNADKRIAALRATQEELKTALQPFAALLANAKHVEHQPDDNPVFGINENVFTVGDLRNAKRVLSRLQSPEGT